jgi:hypothetical protein
MIIIGCDYHPGFQQGMQVRVGMEASGQARWFERLLSELHFELWASIQGRLPLTSKADALSI